MDNKTLIKQYVGIVQKIARVEHRRIPNHMIEYEELVSIGIIAVQTLIKGKSEEQLARINLGCLFRSSLDYRFYLQQNK